MKKELAKTYEPREVEERTYDFWQRGGYFHAKRIESKKPYTIVMPPPNITAQLHVGHALDCTLQDILIRFRRMQGYSALWLPGTDHASIATEAKIVEDMRREGITKDQLGREGFLKRAWEWRDKYGTTIVSQQKKMGSSCDWQRERFTLDEDCNNAVNEAFVRLYDKGLIYRGERIINWCPHCLTSISDAEVEYEQQQGSFWHLRYPLTDGSGYIELATTRPETLLGDTAVAVHPDDERYKALVGKTLTLPLVGREIPIVADRYVEPEFGTGAVKITPAHDPNDFEVGARHNLPIITVLTPDARVTDEYPKYAGMDRYEARRAIVEDLKQQGYLVKIEECSHNVGTCYRCSTTVEPRISKQWFVKMKPLAGPAIEAVRSGETRFVPQRFEKIYFHWLENIRDWCISRQLWWGHRIPAYYCEQCGEITVSKQQPEQCCKCGCTKMEQDPDTLDTWFSSALWPFSTLGWPANTADMDYFYPTSTLVTAYDIIPFWVMRMMFSGIEYTGRAPFDTVLIHGLIRDPQGRKMSKSLGNGVDPLAEIEKYGADALRFALATGNSPGNDMRYMPERVESSRNFANKIWNAARFLLMNLDDNEPVPQLPEQLATEDRWIVTEYNRLVRDVTDNLEKFELGLAVAKLYEFIRELFCDWYIEIAKIRLNSENAQDARNVRAVLVYVFSNTLKLLHPFMPFITEEIWQSLPHEGESIMISEFPEYDAALDFDKDATDFDKVMSAVRAIRNRRAEMGVAPSKKAAVYIAVGADNRTVFEQSTDIIARLASAGSVSVGDAFELENAVSIATDAAKIYIPLGELVDLEEERRRLQKEKDAALARLAQIEAKLANEGFLAKAPEAVVQKQHDDAARLREQIANIDEGLGL